MRNKDIEEIDIMLMDTYLRWKDDARQSTSGSIYLKADLTTPELMDMFLDEVQIFAAKRND
jgi:hypothetical protein